jgi:fructosamine-3-kinase
MHLSGAERFGASPPGAANDSSEGDAPLRIGPLVLPSAPAPDWPTFYGQNRLAPLAARVGLESVTDAVVRRLDQLCGPPEPPARLHGDLWSGNVYGPYLIDPAAYGGHREVDLAMLRLFGSPSPRLLAAYDEVAPRADGHEDRVELYQLFPLLVHAVLFGGSYVQRAERVARRYGA